MNACNGRTKMLKFLGSSFIKAFQTRGETTARGIGRNTFENVHASKLKNWWDVHITVKLPRKLAKL